MREPCSVALLDFELWDGAGCHRRPAECSEPCSAAWAGAMAQGRVAIPTGRVQRTAKVGTGDRRAGRAVRGHAGAPTSRARRRRAREALDARHLEAAERMVDALGTMKGAAMKIGQLASFIDTEFLPARVPRAVPGQARRSCAPRRRRCRGRRSSRCSRRSGSEPVEELFEDFEHEAAAAASIGQVHRAVLPDGRRVAVKIQYPGVAEALRADMQNAGMIMRMAKALAPGPRRQGRRRGAQGARARGARLRVRGAEPAHVLARLPRPPVHLRARRDHAAVAPTACS